MPVRPGAEEWSADGGSTGVLLCHGFTGSPASLRPWGEALAAEGHTVRLPRLPGHGTRWQEMQLTRWTDWYATVERSFLELREQCDDVFVMGLSMGGTLTLRLAEEHADDVAGIVLVNPSVMTQHWLAPVVPLLRHVLPSYPGISNDIKRPGQDEVAYDKIPVKAAHSLTELWQITRADLPRVTAPVLLFRSSVDHVVEPENSEIVLTEISSTDITAVELENSYHVATLDHDADIIEMGSVAFVERIVQARV